MQWKKPTSDSKYEWTEHSIYKMKQYGLSTQRVLRVIRAPYRIETGIVENTVAVMQPGGNIKKGPVKSGWGKPSFGSEEGNISPDGKSWSSEIWVMYQLRNGTTSDKKQVTSDKKNTKLQVKSSEKAKKLMKLTSKKIRIISAWRYPGISNENDPIPAEIMREIEGII